MDQRPRTGNNNPQRRAPQNGAPRRSAPQARRRRKKKSPAKAILAVLLIILIVCAGGYIGVKLASKDDNTANTAANTAPTAAPVVSGQDDVDMAKVMSDVNSDEESIGGLNAENMVKVSELNITPGLDDAWTNILLLGSDMRIKGQSSRTDTMIICSVNKNTGEVKLTSILRDTAVTFDNIGKYNGTYRINAANYFGGPELIMRTINEKLGMNIEYYALVDFTSFSIIAEKLGGIDITISEEEMNQINKNAWKQYRIAKHAGIDESELEATNYLLETYGENTHLNGRQTLAYARIRKIDSDITRAERQRTVLIALLKKVKGRSLAEVMGLATGLFSYVTTNMSIDQLMGLATTVFASSAEVEQLRLPMEKTYVQETRNNESMLYDTDWETNKRELYNFIYN